MADRDKPSSYGIEAEKDAELKREDRSKPNLYEIDGFVRDGWAGPVRVLV